MDEIESEKDAKKKYRWYTTHDELPPYRQRRVPRSCFPSPVADALHLERWYCLTRPPLPLTSSRSMRILPHHQDTGGFFVAALEKTAPMPEQDNTIEVDDQFITEEPPTELVTEKERSMLIPLVIHPLLTFKNRREKG